MGYTALYRKFRPDSFASVKGQDHIVKTLKNQIMADRVGHAYLFCGTRGTGKTTVAKILAKAVNCEHPVDGNPCGVCESCRAIVSGTSMNVIEIDAASNNGVDNIREIREEVAYSPTTGKYKVYIIDEVHMLSIGAFNAILKTLEEPPSYVIFILATTEAHKIPITILSRCQRYDFKRISIDTISGRLMELMEKEQVEVEEKAIRYVAKKADGSMRDALSLLDQCIAFYLGQKLTYDNVLEVLGAVDTEVFSQFLREIVKNNVPAVMRHVEELVTEGRELGQFVTDFSWYLRNLLLLKSSEEMEDVLDVSSDNLVLLKEEAGMVREDTLIRFIRVFSELGNQMKFALSKRVILEVALIKLCRPQMESDELSLLERVRMLEKKLESGMVAVPKASAPGRSAASSNTDDNFFAGLDIPGTKSEKEEDEGGTYEEKAAPEDLQRVMSMWPSIVAETTGRFMVTLRSAVPKYNAAGDDNRLFVVFADFLAEPYINSVEAKNQLEGIISGKLGKQVEVKMILQADEHLNPGRLSKISVEKGLSQIHADIEIEEE